MGSGQQRHAPGTLHTMAGQLTEFSRTIHIGRRALAASISIHSGRRLLQGFVTNPAGSAIVNAIGPIRQVVRGEGQVQRRYLVIARGHGRAARRPGTSAGGMIAMKTSGGPGSCPSGGPRGRRRIASQLHFRPLPQPVRITITQSKSPRERRSPHQFRTRNDRNET
jgi:hypothetical protein